MAAIIEEPIQDTRLTPNSGKYNPSMFSNIISGFSLFLIFLIAITTLWGLVSTFITLSEFSQAAQQGFPQNTTKNNPNTPTFVLFSLRQTTANCAPYPKSITRSSNASP